MQKLINKNFTLYHDRNAPNPTHEALSKFCMYIYKEQKTCYFSKRYLVIDKDTIWKWNVT